MGDGDLPGIRIRFSEIEMSDAGDGLFTRNRIRVMLGKKSTTH